MDDHRLRELIQELSAQMETTKTELIKRNCQRNIAIFSARLRGEKIPDDDATYTIFRK